MELQQKKNCEKLGQTRSKIVHNLSKMNILYQEVKRHAIIINGNDGNSREIHQHMNL